MVTKPIQILLNTNIDIIPTQHRLRNIQFHSSLNSRINSMSSHSRSSYKIFTFDLNMRTKLFTLADKNELLAQKKANKIY